MKLLDYAKKIHVWPQTKKNFFYQLTNYDKIIKGVNRFHSQLGLIG